MSEQSESASVSPAVIGWSIAAFVLSIVQVISDGSDAFPPLYISGFFAKCLVVVVGTICGMILAMVGRAIGKVVDKPILAPVIGLFVGSIVGMRIVAFLLI